MKRIWTLSAAAIGAAAYLPPVAGADTMVEPLYTKSAQRYASFVFDAYAEYYTDRKFQEIDGVDATELRIDLAAPILSRGQLRLSLPFYTDGDGEYIESGDSTDISGSGGTFNFATISYEHQFMDAAQDKVDLMGYIGVGHRTARLKTSNGDYMNHRGNNAEVGIRLDHAVNPSMMLMSDIGYQYYWDTDDLNPSGGGDNFGNLVASAALIKNDRPLKPALELIYRGNFGDYNNLAVVPELIYSFSEVDLKLGIPVGLTSDADDYGVTLGFTYRM
ncbi:MAG: hypothetical protein WBM59_02870 [Sedimenticolaceae bacterium]